MTWRVCQEAKKCPNVYLWLWSFTTTACSYMPEIQWICLCLFCTCNVYSFAFGILSNRWSSKSPHFAWHSSTWALGQAEPILDLHNVHLCPSPGPSLSTPSNLTFLKTFHTVYHVNASDLQSWSDPDARRCLFRKPAWSRLLSEVSVFVTWLWFFTFASWNTGWCRKSGTDSWYFHQALIAMSLMLKVICSTTLNKTHDERYHWQNCNWQDVFRVEATKHWELRAG